MDSSAAIERLRADAAINGRRENKYEPNDPSWKLPGWDDMRVLLAEIDRLNKMIAGFYKPEVARLQAALERELVGRG